MHFETYVFKTDGNEWIYTSFENNWYRSFWYLDWNLLNLNRNSNFKCPRSQQNNKLKKLKCMCITDNIRDNIFRLTCTHFQCQIIWYVNDIYGIVSHLAAIIFIRSNYSWQIADIFKIFVSVSKTDLIFFENSNK